MFLSIPFDVSNTLFYHLQVMLAGQNIDDSVTTAFQMLGYCPQHDALWKNVTIREHIECYAAIRGVTKTDTPRSSITYFDHNTNIEALKLYNAQPSKL